MCFRLSVIPVLRRAILRVIARSMPDTPDSMLNHIYTLDEAAERLRLNKRMVSKVARRVGACSRAGRDYLFTEDDLLEIWKAMRVEPTEGRVPARLIGPAALVEEKAYASLQARAAARKKNRNVRR